MKKILVTGAYGQLGNEIKVLSSKYSQFEYIFTDVDSLDITCKLAVLDFFKAHKVDYVINCAAYTAVDKAEEETELAYNINRDAVEILGEAAKSIDAKMIHISTDYVFDGTAHTPYTEDVAICPQSAYGKTKAEGETSLINKNKDTIIIRTSWLYSSFGNNFAKTMIKLGQERDALNVIFDQIGTPTYAGDLAEAIMKIISKEKWTPGIYHFSNEGVASWFDFTKAIHEIYKIDCNVSAIESKDFPSKTPRPAYSVLNKSKIKSTFDIKIPYWKDGLERCINIIKKGA